MMWDDVKKVSKFLYDQTLEQKDIMLNKLRIISFNNRKESSFKKLGSMVYREYLNGNFPYPQNEDMKKEIEELKAIEEEIAMADKGLEELQKKSDEEREKLAKDIKRSWEKTRGKGGPAGAPEQKEPTEEILNPPGETEKDAGGEKGDGTSSSGEGEKPL